MSHKHILESLTACEEAIRWYNDKDSKEAWAICERGDWLLWIAANLKVDRKLIVLAACDCAEQSLYLIPKGEERPKKAIETARAWTRGEVSLAEVRAAANAAADFYAADADSYAADAVVAAYYAAYYATDTAATYAATYAANAATYVAYSAAAVVDVATYTAANGREEILKKLAELVRSRISWELIEEKLS